MPARVRTALFCLGGASLLSVGLAAPMQAATAATPTALRVMPLGDSITAGVDSSSGNGYRAQLYSDLAGEGHSVDFVGSQRGGNMADPDNEGHSGWRIDQIAGIADSVLAEYQPNVITLHIGTNDLNQPYQPTTASARLSALVDQITADDPTATVFVASLIPTTSAMENQYWSAYNASIPGMVAAKAAAGKHVVYVNMSTALTTADLADSLHPNDGGYVKMGNAWNTAIQNVAGTILPPVSRTGAIASGVAGKCLDDFGGNNASGTKIEIWTCNGTAAQQWTAAADGTLRVEGKCLDATALGTANGTALELWDCNGGANQVWQGYDGGYRNPVSGRCLDDPALSTTDGTGVNLWDCNGGANQRWTNL